MIERTFELRGPEGLGAKPRPELRGPVFSRLHDTLQDAVRMGFLHSSRARGRIPAGLRAAAEVRYIGHSSTNENVTLLHFEVPTFGSAAGELFGQKLLWEDGPQPDQTAFELLGAALGDVRKRRKESNRFDPALLRRIGSYRRMLKQGIESIGLPDTALVEPEQIDSVAVIAAAELCAANPSLVPLIAHDRASFGGMLLSCGITVLLSNLWGFQRGQRWLWWTLLLAGSTAYLGTCFVHWQVGYDALFHLIPAYGGLLALWLGCALSRRYLLD